MLQRNITKSVLRNDAGSEYWKAASETMPRIELDLSSVRQLPVTHSATVPEDYLDVMWYTHLGALIPKLNPTHVGIFARCFRSKMNINDTLKHL